MKKLFKSLLILAILVAACVILNPTEAKAATVDDLTFTLNDDGESYSVTDCNESASGDLIVPETYNNKPVTTIGQGAFSSCSNLTGITIPDSVTTIKNGSGGIFSGCSSLKSITIPFVSGDKANTGGKPFGCFFSYLVQDSDFGRDSKRLQDAGYILVPQRFYNIDVYNETGIFEGDPPYYFAIPKSLKSVKITGGSIYPLTFEGCTNLTDIILPDDATYIGEGAFKDCSNLTDISIPDSVTTIGKSIFAGCDKLNYTTHDNAYYLGNANNPYVILNKADASSITEIEIHSGTKLISDHTFEGADLTKVTLPDSVTFIGDSAFADCNNLTDVYYNGTQGQWKAINMNKDNGALSKATLHFTLCAEAHKWDSGVDTKPATKNEEGIKTFTCSVCNETKTEPVPKLTASASSTTASTAKPGATTAKPGTTTAKPGTTTAKPNATTAKPGVTSSVAVPTTPGQENNIGSNIPATDASGATIFADAETEPTTQTVEDKGGNTGLIIAVVVIVAILAPASGVAAFFFFKKKQK